MSKPLSLKQRFKDYNTKLGLIHESLEAYEVPKAVLHCIELRSQEISKILEDYENDIKNTVVFSVNGKDYTREDLEKAYESWSKEAIASPEDFSEGSINGESYVDTLIDYLEREYKNDIQNSK